MQSLTDNSKLITAAIGTLKKKPDQRKEADIQLLLPFLKSIKFFQERRDMKETDFNYLCERAKHEYFHQNKNVFCYGDYGDKFYILLEGQVAVLVPKKKDKNTDDSSSQMDESVMRFSSGTEQSQNAKRKLMHGNSYQDVQRLMSGSGINRKATLVDNINNRYFGLAKGSSGNEKVANTRAQILQDQNNIAGQNLVEVAQLKSGQSFGELALISNKPRAATIKCMTDAHFLVLQKKDYEQILGRFEEANMNKFVEFLKQMPHFNHWFKNALSKLTYYFTRQKFIRNQTIYKEGDICRFIYIVLDGEFEITKKMRPHIQDDSNLTKYLGPQILSPNQRKSDRQIQFTLQKSDNVYSQRISIVSRGNMIGEEDAIKMRDYTTTLKCVSQNGILLALKTSDFYQRIKTNEETWQYLQKTSLLKEGNIYQSIFRSEKLIKSNVENTKLICKKEEAKDMEIKDIDFFKTTFWGEPIPSRKVERVIQTNQQKRRQKKVFRNTEEQSSQLNFYGRFAQNPKILPIQGLEPSTMQEQNATQDNIKMIPINTLLQNKANFATFTIKKDLQVKDLKSRNHIPSAFYSNQNYINNTVTTMESLEPSNQIYRKNDLQNLNSKSTQRLTQNTLDTNRNFSTSNKQLQDYSFRQINQNSKSDLDQLQNEQYSNISLLKLQKTQQYGNAIQQKSAIILKKHLLQKKDKVIESRNLQSAYFNSRSNSVMKERNLIHHSDQQSLHNPSIVYQNQLNKASSKYSQSSLIRDQSLMIQPKKQYISQASTLRMPTAMTIKAQLMNSSAFVKSRASLNQKFNRSFISKMDHSNILVENQNKSIQISEQNYQTQQYHNKLNRNFSNYE
eukprot:403368842